MTELEYLAKVTSEEDTTPWELSREESDAIARELVAVAVAADAASTEDKVDFSGGHARRLANALTSLKAAIRGAMK